MDWPIEHHRIIDLYLDQNNIRTPISQKDQNALIRDMFTNEDAFEIVKSYVQNGVFPDEFPIVINEDDKLIVIEGNRRLAALKAINEPDIVPAWKEKIKSLHPEPINSIRVVIAPSREAAIKHIANKHTINYRRPWKPLRQAYFYKSQMDNGKSIEELIEEYPDHNIPRFIKMLEMHKIAKSLELDDDLLEKVHNERTFPITNLERFYDDKNVSSFLGIKFNENGQVQILIDTNEFLKGFKKIVEDISNGKIDSRKYNTIKERQQYLNSLDCIHKPDLTKKGKATSKDFKEQKIKDKSDAKLKGKKSKPKPRGLFWSSDLPFRISSHSLRTIYDELKKIDVGSFPNAAHDLLRTFLECSLVFFLKETGDYDNIKKAEQHIPKLGEMLSYIINKKCGAISDEHIIEIVQYIKGNWQDSYSLARLNMVNHNENWVSTEQDVRAAWSRLEKLFKLLLNPKLNSH